MSLIQNNSLLKGKKCLIMGLANDKSIAWGIAQALHASGAELAFSYQGDILKKRVTPLAGSLNSNIILECDVSNDESIENLFSQLKKNWESFDLIVHAIAYSDKNELKGDYTNTSLNNFNQTMAISCYSFTSVLQKSRPMLNNGGSAITLSYYGAEKFIPHYNVMGVAKAALETSVKYLAEDLGKNLNFRVNAISAGPIKTLAASGIDDMRKILTWNKENSPLRRNVSITEVGNSAVFLLSDLASAVTGEVLHVDCGYHVMGMCAYDKGTQN